MHIFKEKLLHLIHCRTVSNKALRALLQHDPELKNLYVTPLDDLQRILQLTPSQMKIFSRDFRSIEIQRLLKLYSSKNIMIITYNDPEYPQLLKEIYDPPIVLFSIGDTSILEKNAIAIVGARDANQYAEIAIDHLLPRLIKENFVIVSGLANGTDTIAHKRAIAYGGKTIAILGGGFFHIYPRENKQLAEKIKQSHLLISEYPPIQRPEKWHFPMRNRIISGLALGTIVVQAKSKSGSLITADCALEVGREVFALPGNIDDPLSAGTNHLIQQGAKLVTSSQDIIDELNLDY
ncbi:DNA-processing protein DprA [Bacillus sp. FSL K6-3431]|uniref:DNA-processing protein DprA n=1 Tax=Bacillus sp. FSL K6-3431 TaxID=2921500 RepID=UPI0030FA180F